MAVGIESQKRDLSNVNISKSEGNPDGGTVEIMEDAVDAANSNFCEISELDGSVDIKHENNHDSDIEIKSEPIEPFISNGSAVQPSDSGNGRSEMQAFMVEREKLQKYERIAGESSSESNAAPDKEVWEEDTKCDQADIKASNPVALENDVVMQKKRKNFKGIRKKVNDFDLVDLKDEVKMEIVHEEIEERPHKKQKMVSCNFYFICLFFICSDRILTFIIKSIRSPAKVGLVVTDLITSPVVAGGGGRPPPPPPPSTSARLSFFAQPRLSEDLSLRGGLPSSSAAICLRLVDGLDFLFDF